MTGDNALKACDLLPCPICGAPPKLTVRDSGAADYSCSSGHPPEHLIRTYGVNEAEAREAWNTRSPVEDARGELVERLRPALQLLPIETRDLADYAEATGPSFQAMTMKPSAFLALNALPEALDALAKSLPSPRGWQDARNEAFEEAAQVVDQCNREGPYNAIGAASRIRALKPLPSLLESEK